MMENKNCRFIDEDGTFALENPQGYSHLYFPIAGEGGLKSAVTPMLGGDAKLDQNHFVLEPVSAENLHNQKGTRNFWCRIKNRGVWSATGASAVDWAKRFTDSEDEARLVAGLMWHRLIRESAEYGLKAEITSYVLNDVNAEVMQVELTNTNKEELVLTPIAAVPIYGRSADNIRDHRHVTSLLHRISVNRYGVEVTPTLSFDERGHQLNDTTYFVYGIDEEGNVPEQFYPVVEAYIGEGGCFERPLAAACDIAGVGAGARFEGREALGGIRFAERSLAPGKSIIYTILIGAADSALDADKLAGRFASRKKGEREFQGVKNYWQRKINVSYQTADPVFNHFMRWVSFQPVLRRIYGCSFLPDHDYGKGGRGWRDLWQDCLALLMMNPEGVRQMLVDNFGGVRMDGTNATIIGTNQGEFVADRNNITRVWMDHGVWPFMTTKLYIDQTGDIEILGQKSPYFKDRQIYRGTGTDNCWDEGYGCLQKTEQGVPYEGTVLEHLLIQNLTAFYEVGEHNELRLRGADWNDALDMAGERGESVAFTSAYASNLKELAELILAYGERTDSVTVPLMKELLYLLEQGCSENSSGVEREKYGLREYRAGVLERYVKACGHNVSGETEEVCVRALAEDLQKKAEFLMMHIRENEWVEDSRQNGWYNGYYDNHGRKVEGEFESGVRMMLTSQVFAVMSGTADEEQVQAIIKSADTYLYREEIGGYRLNTDFGELKTDLGRMFGFAYGEKENGAVFSHMTVMYANALYKRGFVQAGYRALKTLQMQSADFERSHIYPGIPEYFNADGRGMYHYLTGAASWYMLTVITEMFGVRGRLGRLELEPKLLAEQFDEEGRASVSLTFADIKWKITYYNRTNKEYGEYRIGEILCDGNGLDAVEREKNGKSVRLDAGALRPADKAAVRELEIELK